MKFVLLVLTVIVFHGTTEVSAATFILENPGNEEVVDYKKYGSFEGVGTEKYKYVIKDGAGLRKAVGEGIFPNSRSVYQDKDYRKFKKDGVLDGNKWDFVNSDNYQANFYKWATASEEPGIKLFYTATMLEKSGNLKQAIKAYYAIIVHFPKSIGYTYWDTPWYVGPVAIDKINYITKLNPHFCMKLVDAEIKVENHYDEDTKNDVFIVNPGKLKSVKPKDLFERRVKLNKLKVVKTIGKGKVKLVKYSNKHWQLLVNKKPYVIRGMAYSPNMIGLSPDEGTLNVSRDWMFADYNKNGKIDGPYEAWVDANKNNKKDKKEVAVGDFKLMQDMGVNVLRLYHHTDLNKKLLLDGYKRYGFMYMIGDFIGMYGTGSKAEWFYGTDYTNPEHIKNMLESVREMVETYKDEPYTLMWVLGNENNYGAPGEAGVSAGSGCRARIQPEAYYKFVNEAAKLIKSLDPLKRPVAICNGDLYFLDICAANAPEIDVFGVNAYRGEQGFGSLWQNVSDVYDRPVVLTEYGCSAYHPTWKTSAIEEAQSRYHKGNWLSIEGNIAGFGTGNALGGVVFEWVDEWWKANSDLPEKVQLLNKDWYRPRSAQYKNLKPDAQDIVPQFGAPFLDGWSYEEWLGLASQGNGKDSPFQRQLRKSYFTYKSLWKKFK